MEISFAIVNPLKIIKKVEETIAEQAIQQDIIINKFNMNHFTIYPIINSIVFSLVGIIILLLFYFFIEKLTPEKTWKEIVENKNVALAIVFAALILGISIIISGAIHG